MAEVRRVALITSRSDLRSVVVRVAGLVGAQVDVVESSLGIRGLWRSAAAVVVGADVARAVASASLPRRPDVVVVTGGAPDDALWRTAVDIGAQRVLGLPDDERLLVDVLGDAAEGPAVSGAAIAVVAGCGGAGASTLAVGLALVSARRTPTLLVDGDRLGGGLDVLLGIERVDGARWPDLAATRGRLSAAALSEALPVTADCSVLAWDRRGSDGVNASAADAVMDAALRGFQQVVVDLPRVLDDAAAVMAAAADTALVVVPASVRATAAATLVLDGLRPHCGRIHLVVRDPGSGRLTAAEVSAALGVPLAGVVRSDPAVVRAAERGEPPLRRSRGGLAALCRELLASSTREPAAA
jgi:secretion/DNA translocation related CpaE-like protein